MTEKSVGTSSFPAEPVEHLDALPVGTRLAEFEILSLLGVGGFGMVYRAYDHSLHRTVAIKEYMPAALTSRKDDLTVSTRSTLDLPSYLNGLESFVAEARLLAKFDHPSLVKVYRFWEANNTAYMVMPLYIGMTLKQARNQMNAPPDEAWLRTMLWSILQALQLLHENNMVHRDVTPDNIFLQDLGPPVLLDLGSARRAIADHSQKLTAILKVNYAPIEQYADLDDLHQGPWTDLYSLAAVVYNCLCYEPPLPATTRVVRDTLMPLANVVQTIRDHLGQTYTQEFVSTIWHALAVQPADRPASVGQFIQEMRLQSAEELARFDWRDKLRSQLAPIVDESVDTVWQSLEMNSDSYQNTVLELPLDEPVPRTSRSYKRWLWLGVCVALVLVFAFWWQVRSVVEAPPIVAAPEPAVMPVQAVVPQTVASEPVMLESPPVEMVETAPPEAVESIVPPVPTVLPKVTPASSAKTSKPHRVQAKPVASAKASPAPAKELCADTNFLLRPMCIHLECQKERNADLLVCVEDRNRYPKSGVLPEP